MYQTIRITQSDDVLLHLQASGMPQTLPVRLSLGQYQQIHLGKSYVIRAKCDQRRKEAQNLHAQM